MTKTKRNFDWWEIGFVSFVFAAGLAIRIRFAWVDYMNPDEIEVTMASFGSLREAFWNSLNFSHPPLLAMLNWIVCRVSRADFAVRLVPVLSGSLFPLLLFFWLRRVAGSVSGMAVLVLLTLAPYQIILSAQFRPYTLALLFVSASLLVLDIALERTSRQMMTLFGVLLGLCILADYSAAWFVGAAGVFVLMRFRSLSNPVRNAWIFGQAGAILLYVFLFLIQVSRFQSNKEVAVGAIDGWLRDEFPHAGHILGFPFIHTLEQFQFFTASRGAGWLALFLFVAAVFLLWTGRSSVERCKARGIAVLLVLPFVLGLAGAYAHLFPYGYSRQTIIFEIFIAAGIAVFLGTLPRVWGLAMVGGVVLLSPLWFPKYPVEDILFERHQRWQIDRCMEYMRKNIPPGSLIFTEGETLTVLAYYFGHDKTLLGAGASHQFLESKLAGIWRTSTRDYNYTTPELYAAALSDFRLQYGLTAAEPVWVLDGGWAVVAGEPDPKLPFTKAVRVFQTPAP